MKIKYETGLVIHNKIKEPELRGLNTMMSVLQPCWIL